MGDFLQMWRNGWLIPDIFFRGKKLGNPRRRDLCFIAVFAPFDGVEKEGQTLLLLENCAFVLPFHVAFKQQEEGSQEMCTKNLLCADINLFIVGTGIFSY